jgi:hypothetical protein
MPFTLHGMPGFIAFFSRLAVLDPFILVNWLNGPNGISPAKS